MQKGHSIVVSAADEAAWSSDFFDIHMTEGRHNLIAAAENSRANALADQYKESSIDMLASLSVGASNRIIAAMMPVSVSPDHVSDEDREAHVARLSRECDVHLRRLNALTACVTQLVALETVYFARFSAMNDDVYRHESTADLVCVGCELTDHAQAQNRALRVHLMEELAIDNAAAQVTTP